MKVRFFGWMENKEVAPNMRENTYTCMHTYAQTHIYTDAYTCCLIEFKGKYVKKR